MNIITDARLNQYVARPIRSRPRPFSSTFRNGLGQSDVVRGFFANSRNAATPAFAECEAETATTLFAKTDLTASDPSDESENRPTR